MTDVQLTEKGKSFVIDGTYPPTGCNSLEHRMPTDSFGKFEVTAIVEDGNSSRVQVEVMYNITDFGKVMPIIYLDGITPFTSHEPVRRFTRFYHFVKTDQGWKLTTQRSEIE